MRHFCGLLILAVATLAASTAQAGGHGHIGFWRWSGLGWGPGYHAGRAALPAAPVPVAPLHETWSEPAPAATPAPPMYDNSPSPSDYLPGEEVPLPTQPAPQLEVPLPSQPAPQLEVPDLDAPPEPTGAARAALPRKPSTVVAPPRNAQQLRGRLFAPPAPAAGTRIYGHGSFGGSF